MKSITFATTSTWKLEQAKSYFKLFGIQVDQASIELPESRSENVSEIAKEKIDFAYNQLREPVFVIDGAFHIKALNDFPKTYVKFAEKYIGASGIIKLLEGKTNRSYVWPNVLYYSDGKSQKYFIGYIKGNIVSELPVTKGNGFDLIQIPDGYATTFSQMDAEELKHFELNVWQPTMFKDFAEWFTKELSLNKV